MWRNYPIQLLCWQSTYGVYGNREQGKRKACYTGADIDVLVAYIITHDLWYIIPVAPLQTKSKSCPPRPLTEVCSGITCHPERGESIRARMDSKSKDPTFKWI
jgi:hypothetical protein